MNKKNIKPGDRVKFLNDVGGGVVTAIVDKKTANVLTDEDWEIPVMIDELLVVDDDEYEDENDAFGNFVKQGKKTENAEAAANEDDEFEEVDYEKPTDDINVFFAFVPADEKDVANCDLNMFLINDSNFEICYNFMIPEGKVYQSHTGILEANTKLQLDTIKREQLNSLSHFAFQFLFYKKQLHERKDMVDTELKIKPVKFFKAKSYKTNDFFHKKAVIFHIVKDDMEKVAENLTKEEIYDIITEKEVENKKINAPKIYKKNENPAFALEEVDLHIHELVDQPEKLSNKEMLDIQMNTFKKALNDAIARRIKAITFIHGVGNGILKHELRRTLEKDYKGYRYQDASFEKYGFGATMVLIR